MPTITGYKDGSYLIFKREGENYKVRYDLKDGSVAKNRGKNWRQVKSIKDFFTHTSPSNIIDGFEDEPYQTFMKKIDRGEYHCTNTGTLLERLRKYSHLENYSLQDLEFQFDITEPLSFYPMDIIRFFAKWEITISKQVEGKFRQNFDLFVNICRHLENNYEPNDHRVLPFVRSMFGWNFDTFVSLTQEPYNCDYKRLTDYLIYLVNHEALSFENAMTQLRDYQNMQRQICHSSKYEKYPKFLASVHEIVLRNYREAKKEYDQDEWDAIIPHNLEYAFGKYAIVVPHTPQALMDEGADLQHCVGSYCQRVLDGKTTIVFMRKRRDEKTEESLLNESLVTVEVQNGAVVQALGKQNRVTTEEEYKFLKYFAKNKGLKFAVPHPNEAGA